MRVSDDVGQSTFVLFDTQVKKELQVTAKELIDKQVKVIINSIEVLHFQKEIIPLISTNIFILFL